MKRQETDLEKTFAHHKALSSECVKNSLNLTVRKQPCVFKWAKDLSGRITEEGIQLAHSTWKDAQHQLLLEKCKLKLQRHTTTYLTE